MEKLKAVEISGNPLLERIRRSRKAALLLVVAVAISTFDSWIKQVSQGSYHQLPVPTDSTNLITDTTDNTFLDAQIYGGAADGEFWPSSLRGLNLSETLIFEGNRMENTFPESFGDLHKSNIEEFDPK